MTPTLARNSRRRIALSLLAAGMLTLAVTGCSAVRSAVGADEIYDGSYTSTSGSHDGQAVDWLHSHPLTLSFDNLNGGPTAILGTPCNTVNIPVEVRGRELVPHTGDMMATAKGCLGDAGAQEHWATAFFSTPMTFSRAGGTLTLKTDDAEIRFRY